MMNTTWKPLVGHVVELSLNGPFRIVNLILQIVDSKNITKSLASGSVLDEPIVTAALNGMI